MQKRLGIVGLLCLLPVGCNKKSEATKADPSPPTAVKSTHPSTTNAVRESPGAPMAATSGVAATASAAALPPGRSSVPTLDEWNATTKEVTVKGSSALGCETKMIREYLRVLCRGKNDTGGVPKHIVLQKGIVENHIFVDREIVSLVVPYVEGINATFVFTWSDTTHPFVLKWPRGTAKPAIIGTFEGAKSPLDGTAIDLELVKRCQGVYGFSDGDFPPEDIWALMSLNKYCLSTYRNDCSKLKDCNFGEPGAPVKCPSDRVPVLQWLCLERCNPDGSCPSGSTCERDNESGISVCVEE